MRIRTFLVLAGGAAVVMGAMQGNTVAIVFGAIGAGLGLLSLRLSARKAAR